MSILGYILIAIVVLVLGAAVDHLVGSKDKRTDDLYEAMRASDPWWKRLFL